MLFPAPSWYPYPDEPHLPGCPSFITPREIGRFTTITVTGMRRLHDAVLRRSRATGAFPWWPDERPTDLQYRYVLAMGIVADRDLRALSSLHYQVNPGIHFKRGVLFEYMTLWAADGNLKPSELPSALFFALMERGLDFAAGMHASITDFDWSTHGGPELGDWFADNYPDVVVGRGADFRFDRGAIRPNAAESTIDFEPEPERSENTSPSRPAAVQQTPVLDVPKPDLVLPGIQEAARLGSFARSGLGFIKREAERLLDLDVDAIDRKALLPLSAHVLSVGRSVRRRHTLLSGPVDVTERVAAFASAVADLHPTVAKTFPVGPWEVPRESAPEVLERMGELLSKADAVRAQVANVDHMEALVAVKKGKSKDSLKRRAMEARSALDLVIIEFHDLADALGGDLHRLGNPVRVLEFQTPEDPLVLATREIDLARQAEAEVRHLLEHAEQERDEAQQDRDDAWSRVAALQAVVDSMRRTSTADVETVPTDVDQLLEWAQTRLGAHVVLLPKAIRETRRARNVNVEYLHEALVFLRDVYVPMRLGSMDRETYEAALRASRFDETPCFSNPGSAEAFDGYHVSWRGSRLRLDRHLKWGVSTQNMLRIYFAWDDATGSLVVGHMPTHLDNWSTN